MIIQSDREAAAKAGGHKSWDDAVYHLGENHAPLTARVKKFAAYREAILSDARVEEVARAIVEATDGPWDWFSELGQEAARTQARAALKTLRGEA